MLSVCLKSVRCNCNKDSQKSEVAACTYADKYTQTAWRKNAVSSSSTIPYIHWLFVWIHSLFCLSVFSYYFGLCSSIQRDVLILLLRYVAALEKTGLCYVSMCFPPLFLRPQILVLSDSKVATLLRMLSKEFI